MLAEDLVDGIAVAHDIAVELPGTAQAMLEQKAVRACRFTIHTVVGTHDAGSLAFYNRRSERGQIGIFHIVMGDFHVACVSRRLRATVNGEMLRRRNRPQISWIIPLHAADERDGHPRSQEWIFAVRFLSSSPARVAENIYVGCPEIETLQDVATAGPHGAVMLCPALGADGGRHFVGKRGIECGRNPNRLRKNGGDSSTGNSVQR